MYLKATYLIQQSVCDENLLTACLESAGDDVWVVPAIGDIEQRWTVTRDLQRFEEKTHD